jgi:hypothetical protein
MEEGLECAAMDTKAEQASLLNHGGYLTPDNMSGTSSRVFKGREKSFTVGVICQANYGQLLDLRPVGKFLAKESKEKHNAQLEQEITGKPNEGSCIIIIAYKPQIIPIYVLAYKLTPTKELMHLFFLTSFDA